MKTIHLIFIALAVALLFAAPASAEPASATSDPWDAIKDLNYDQRADFAAGTGRLVKKVEDQVSELKARRAHVPVTSIQDWDFAMKELIDAHAYLRSTIDDLKETTFETWDDAKEKIGLAWKHTQDAYDKVKSSTTAS